MRMGLLSGVRAWPACRYRYGALVEPQREREAGMSARASLVVMGAVSALREPFLRPAREAPACARPSGPRRSDQVPAGTRSRFRHLRARRASWEGFRLA